MQSVLGDIANIERALKQLQSAGPSDDALKLLDIILVLLNSTRREIGRTCTPAIHVNVITWAFTCGKSPRAEEVRRMIANELHSRWRRQQRQEQKKTANRSPL